nr:immunoglobulin heavy chain junction region [Macaca mulatta]MOW88636.1 immunoglobulin heavy chain junction region [Macaca mulatta]MOW89834.1 immunoglobulin heavy chain junction region [Macaca mulatta]MOW92259.1 immunoglobulin heavy chain junction region [Macaca mulatta]
CANLVVVVSATGMSLDVW